MSIVLKHGLHPIGLFYVMCKKHQFLESINLSYPQDVTQSGSDQDTLYLQHSSPLWFFLACSKIHGIPAGKSAERRASSAQWGAASPAPPPGRQFVMDREWYPPTFQISMSVQLIATRIKTPTTWSFQPAIVTVPFTSSSLPKGNI